VGGGGRKRRRSAAAGDRDFDLGVDLELLRLDFLHWQHEGGVAVRTVVAAWLEEARSGGASTGSSAVVGGKNRGRGKDRGAAARG
jgi:hypothetical protein